MSAALLSIANTIELPAEPGLSPRAARSIFKVYLRLANNQGEFKYGIRGSKVAELAEYSLATVRRAQRYLVEQGFLERIQIGGGRASTRWRIVLDRLGLTAEEGHSSEDITTQHPAPADTAQRRRPMTFTGLFTRGSGMSPAPSAVCQEHGSEGGFLKNGAPRCPSCRRTHDRE